MIRKIRREEYLKGYGAMSDGERRDYLHRVGEWLADEGRKLLDATERPMAKAQNIVLLSARWKEPEVRMFAEGVRLLSALMDVADTWLPTQLYAKSAYRAIRQIVGVLSEVSGFKFQVSSIPVWKPQCTVRAALPAGKPTGTVGVLVITEEQKQRIVEKYTKKAMAKMAIPAAKPQGTVAAGETKTAIPAAKPQGTVAAGETKKPLPTIKTVSKEYDPATDTVRVQCAVVPARPKHIDQYIHLLPEKTQERAKQYGPLKREIEAARENMRLLMNDPHSSAADREKWAKLAARNDEKIAKINAELDREWDKVAATGRVVVDDLGMAHLIDGEPSTVSSDKFQVSSDKFQVSGDKFQVSGDKADKKREADAPQEKPETRNLKPETSKADDKRREYLKKWLRDTRTNPSDDRRKQWQKNCKELLALGGEITESIRKAGEYYGANLAALEVKSEKL